MRSIILFYLVLLSFVYVPDVLALSCAEPRTIEEEYASSEIVFRGMAEEVDRANITFQLLESWKGSTPAHMEIMVSDMWMDVKQGEQYLIYANQTEYGLTANICGRTGLWKQSKEDALQFPDERKILVNENQIISDSSTHTPQQDTTKFIPWMIVIISILLLTVILVLVKKARKS